MPRGKTALYDSFITSDATLKNTKKGRSEVLIQDRDKCLCARYFYYTYHLKKTYPKTLSELSKEFFLSETWLINCLTKNHEFLKPFFDNKTPVIKLKQKYHWFNWN